MNRPPRKGPRKYVRRPIIGRFDPTDEKLIERVSDIVLAGHILRTPEEKSCAECIAYAVQQFHSRLNALRPWKVRNGEFYFLIHDPETAFDKFVVRRVMQNICEQTGKGVALARSLRRPGCSPDAGRCPDVIFPPTQN